MSSKIKGRIIISLTTTPSRINLLEPVLKNILEDQTIKPDYLVLYIPETFLRTNKKVEVPDYLTNFAKIHNNFLFKQIQDKGPITKIYYTFQEFNRPSDIIISIDDDILYEKHFIEELLEGYYLFPFNIIGFMGFKNGGYVHTEHIQIGFSNRQIKSVEGLGGYRGILYPRKLIKDDFYEHFEKCNQEHFELLKKPLLEDDNFISCYFKHKNICMFVIGTFFPGNLQSNNIRERINIKFLDSSDIGALYLENNHNNMNVSCNLIKQYFNQ